MLKRYKNYILSDEDFQELNNIKNIPKINPALNQSNQDHEEKKEIINNDFIANKKKEIKEEKEKEKEKYSIKKIILCEVCDKRLESKKDYALHMSSKNHKHKMRELLRKELKQYGSIKKVLLKEKLILPYRRWKINHARYLLYGFALNRYLKR